MIRLLSVLGIVSIVVGLASCSQQRPQNATGKLRITATTGMIADAAKTIGGPHVEVTGLMGPGVDPHLYKATQGDLRRLGDSDLILYNGLHLEGRMADTLVQMAHRVTTVAVGQAIPEEQLREPPEMAGMHDPHIWFDVSLWRLAVERAAQAISEADPAHRDEYRRNADAYIAQLDELHAYCKARISEIPEEARLMVTAHDAFGYFGRAYGIEVRSIQGISTAAEYGLQDLARLVDFLVERRVKAVFIESSVPRQSIDALMEGVRANGHEIKLGGELFSDALGAAGTPEGTYIGMVRHNVDTIVEALK